MFVEKRLPGRTTEPGLNVALGPPRDAPVLLLHGVTRQWRTFRPLLPGLTGRRRVVALDFRGHGGSPPDSEQRYLVVDYAADVVETLDRLGVPRATLYGHSLGAMVAAAVASDHPDRVDGLALEDPPLHTMGRRLNSTVFQSFFEGVASILRHEDSIDGLAEALGRVELRDPRGGPTQRLGEVRDRESLRFMAECLSRLDPRVLTPIVEGRWLDGYDVEDTFGRIRCPVLLLQADPAAGGMLTDDDARDIKDLVAVSSDKRFRLERFAGAPHLIHSTRPDEVTGAVDSFLDELDGRTRTSSTEDSPTETAR